MKRITMSTLFGLVLLLTSTASAARTRHTEPRKCRPQHAHVIAADPSALVYEAFDPPFGDLEIYGCAYGTRLSYLLGPPAEFSPSGGGGLKGETVGGTMVAYEESLLLGQLGIEPTRRELVIVRNLRTGRVVYRVPTGTSTVPTPRSIGIGPAVAIVVKSDGSVAWIVETGYPVAEYQVHAVDKSGSRVLASGTNIDPHSLALAGGTFYWTQGGKPASAVLN
jgi:hypothetical protein